MCHQVRNKRDLYLSNSKLYYRSQVSILNGNVDFEGFDCDII